MEVEGESLETGQCLCVLLWTTSLLWLEKQTHSKNCSCILSPGDESLCFHSHLWGPCLPLSSPTPSHNHMSQPPKCVKAQTSALRLKKDDMLGMRTQVSSGYTSTEDKQNLQGAISQVLAGCWGSATSKSNLTRYQSSGVILLIWKFPRTGEWIQRWREAGGSPGAGQRQLQVGVLWLETSGW